MMSDSETLRQGIMGEINKLCPMDVLPTVTTDALHYGYVIVELNDRITPRIVADGPKLFKWLRSPEATWEKLQKFCKRKAVPKPTEQSSLGLEIESNSRPQTHEH